MIFDRHNDICDSEGDTFNSQAATFFKEEAHSTPLLCLVDTDIDDVTRHAADICDKKRKLREFLDGKARIAANQCKVPSEGLTPDCTDGFAIHHELSEGFGLTRVCAGIPKGGAQSHVYQASTCCVSSSSVCEDEMSLSAHTWTHTLFKGASPIAGAAFNSPTLARNEVKALQLLRGDPAIPKLYAVIESPINFNGYKYIAPSIVFEFVNGETVDKYLLDIHTMWSHYLADPSSDTAVEIKERINCVVRKAIMNIDRFAQMGYFHGDYHLQNVLVLNDSESEGCPDVKVIDWNGFSEADSTKPDSTLEKAQHQLVHMRFFLHPAIQAITTVSRGGLVVGPTKDFFKRVGREDEVKSLEEAASALHERFPVSAEPDQRTRQAVHDYIGHFNFTGVGAKLGFQMHGRWMSALASAYREYSKTAQTERSFSQPTGCVYNFEPTPAGMSLHEYMTSAESPFWSAYRANASLDVAVEMDREVKCIMKKVVTHMQEGPSVSLGIEIIVNGQSVENGCPSVMLRWTRKCDENPDLAGIAMVLALQSLAADAYLIQVATTASSLDKSSEAYKLADSLGFPQVPVLLIPDEEFDNMVKAFYLAHPTSSVVGGAFAIDSWDDMVSDTVIESADKILHTNATLSKYSEIRAKANKGMARESFLQKANARMDGIMSGLQAKSLENFSTLEQYTNETARATATDYSNLPMDAASTASSPGFSYLRLYTNRPDSNEASVHKRPRLKTFKSRSGRRTNNSTERNVTRAGKIHVELNVHGDDVKVTVFH